MRRATSFLAAVLLGLGGCASAVPLPPRLVEGRIACQRCFGRGARHCHQCLGTQDDCRKWDAAKRRYLPTGPCRGSGIMICKRCGGAGQ